MAIPSLIIKRISGGDYLIADLGIVVPNADQTEITGLLAIRNALCSVNLYSAAESEALKLNDGTRDIPVAEISCFMRRFDTGHVDDVEAYTDLPETGVERQIYLVADEHATYQWNGSGWTQTCIDQKRVGGIVVSKFGSSAPTEYKHPSGAAISTYERFQSGKDNPAGAGFAGASREWIAGDGGDGGGGDYDGGDAGDLLVRPGAGGALAGAGSDGAMGNFVVWDGVTQFFKVRRDGLTTIHRTDLKAASTDGLVLENPTPATVGETVQMSLRTRWRGHAWDQDDAVNRTHDFIIENLPVTHATTTFARLKIGHSLDGAAYTYPLTLTDGGTMVLGGSLVIGGSTSSLLYSSANDVTLEVQPRSFTVSDSAVEMVTGTFSGGDATQFVGLMVRPTYSQSGTAAASDFVVSRKENSVGTGPQYLVDLGTNTDGTYSTHTTKFRVSTSGVLYAVGNIATGTNIAVGPAGAVQSYSSNYTLTIQSWNFSITDSAIEMATGAWTHSTGEGVAVEIKPVWNCSGDASTTALKITTTETSVGSGADNLIWAGVGASPVFRVSNAGAMTVNSTLNAGNNTVVCGSVQLGGGTRSITTTSDGNITMVPNGTGIVIVDAAELKMKSGKKLSLGDGGAVTDAGTWYNGVHCYFNLISGDYYFQHNSVTKWAWTSAEVHTLDGYYFSLGSGGYAADWYAKYTGTNCEMKIVAGEWQFFGGASEIYVINSTGQHGWFGVTPVAQQAHIDDASGGATVDAEARTAINTLLAAIENYGLLAAA